MKAISAIIAVILILMIVVALSSLAYMFFSKMFSSVTTTGTTAVSQVTTALAAQMKVESISVNSIYIRNIGQSDLTDFSVYVNDEPADFNVTPSVIKSGELGIVKITDSIRENDDIRITTAQGALANKKAPDPCKEAVLCLKFDEGSGTTVRDSSPYGNDGTLRNLTGSCTGTGCPSWTTGKSGYALDFDGIGDYVEVADSSSLDLTTKATIEMWIKIPSLTKVGGLLVKYPGTYSYDLYIYPQVLNFQVVGATSATISGSFAVTDNTWKHVAVVYDGTVPSLKIYVNGVRDTAATVSGTIPSSINPNALAAIIGWRGITGELIGTIDEVRIYNKAIY